MPVPAPVTNAFLDISEPRRGDCVVFLEQFLELVVDRERRAAADVRGDYAALLQYLLLEVYYLLDVLSDVVQNRQDEVVRLYRPFPVASEILVVDVKVEIEHRTSRHRADRAAIKRLEHLVTGVPREDAYLVAKHPDEIRDVLSGGLALDLVVDDVRGFFRKLCKNARRARLG